jgi:hypothetical protein
VLHSASLRSATFPLVAVFVRHDLDHAQQRAWRSLGEPGAWFDGIQRRELAATALAALEHPDELPPWVAPSTLPGRLPDVLHAPASAHDVAHRVAAHAGTLTDDWYRSMSSELGELPYVEVVGLVCVVAAVSRFRRAAGLDPLPLPDVMHGDPSGERPAHVVAATLNWVPVAAPADQTAAVVQAFTAVPSTNRVVWSLADAQYIPDAEMVDPRWTRGTLTRPQIELVAMRVSQLRQCFF